jgi:hypothetical protein
LTPNWQIQATYGRYIARLDDGVTGNETGVGGAPRIETVYRGPAFRGLSYDQAQALLHDDAYWPRVTAYVSPDSGTTVMARDLDSPHSDEITLSLRGALPRNSGTMVLAYTNRKYRNLIEDYFGGVCDYGLDFGRACPAGDTTTVTAPNGEAITTVDTTVYANDSRAKRNYDALTAIVDWRPNGRLQLGGNYTYAITKGNYEGEGRNQPASGGAFGNAERARDLAHAAPYGYADDDIRHRLNVYGTYRFDWDRFGAVTLGTLLRYESALPYSLVAQVQQRDIPEYVSTDAGTYSHYFSARGARRFDDYFSWDLSTRYEIPVFRSLRPQLELSVRNLLNNHSVLNFNTTSLTAVYSDPDNPSPDNLTGVRPNGSCGFDSEPSLTCTGFGRIRNQDDYQLPRQFLVTVGFQF